MKNQIIKIKKNEEKKTITELILNENNFISHDGQGKFHP